METKTLQSMMSRPTGCARAATLVGRIGSILLTCLSIGVASTVPTEAATRVWLMYGLGDNAFGSSSGIDVIASKARQIPGVVQVNVRNYRETQRIYDEVRAAPAGDRIVLGGYSC